MSNSRMAMLCAVSALVLCGSICSGQDAATDVAAKGFVTAEGSKLYLHGEEYRAIGVNVPNLHSSYAGFFHHNTQVYGSDESARQAIIDAVEDAGAHGLAFIRFFASPGYPVNMDKLYFRDRERYWSTMDEVFDLCRKRNVRLVPSFNTFGGWYQYYGEVGQAILDPESKTWAALHEYIRDFVSRYKDDPIVLMWELQNEGMHMADVDRKGKRITSKALHSPGKEVRETGVREDSFTWDMVQQIYKEQTAFIKGIDPNHLVTSGDAATRNEATSRRETFPDFKYRNDTLREFIANNVLAQPEPLDVYSYHHYGSYGKPNPRWHPWSISNMDLLRCKIRSAHSVLAPVFIGELGQRAPKLGEDPEAAWMMDCIDVLEDEEASLAALWVWHFPWQPDLTVDSKSHPKLVERMAEFNRKHAGL